MRRTYELLHHRPYSWQRILLNQMARELGATRVPCFPSYLEIEPTNYCDQRCPFCETGKGSLQRSRGMMSLNTLQRIMDEFGKYANFIDLYMMGEPFLNPEIYDMIRYVKRWPVTVKIDTNGMAVDPVKTVASGLDEIWFQLGGIDQNTHTVYRRGGNLDKAFQNIRTLVAERKRRNDYRTVVKMGLIVMKHNEHQWNDFVKLARRLGVDGVVEVAGGVRTAEEASKYLPENSRLRKYDEEDLKHGILRRAQQGHCRYAWNAVLISWDGSVHACPKDHYNRYEVGNINEQSFAGIWNGPRMRWFRRMILEKGNCTPSCYYCPGYSGTNHWKLFSPPFRERHKDLSWKKEGDLFDID